MAMLMAARRHLTGWTVARWTTAVLLLTVVLCAAVLVRNLALVGSTLPDQVPQNPAMEAALGIRVSQVAVVGDGGLITVSYVALDPEKASKLQYDRDHPPQLLSEARRGGTTRVSLMRQGHNVRAGQTYYLVYQNTAGAIRPNELVTLIYGGFRLEHVPVL